MQSPMPPIVPLAAFVMMFSFPSMAQTQLAQPAIPKKNLPESDGCRSLDGLSPVTPAFLREHKLFSEELKKLQYYAENTILLSRLVTPSDERLAAGKLISVSGNSYEIVGIECGTPGIATDVRGNPSTLERSEES